MRFRGKVMLGFAVVLAITAISMGIAYLGFERVSSGVTSYRNSVSEADLARNIDRELISYRGWRATTWSPAMKTTPRRRWRPRPA